MNAEKRSRFLELYFHIVLALFALASIGISVVGDVSNVRLNDSILSFTSITTLCLSLLIFGFKFGETAANHRSCYLSLQKLRASDESNAQVLEDQYIETLRHHPNHTTGDYMRLATENIFQSEQSITSPDGKKVHLSRWRRTTFALGWVTSRVLLVSFGAMPFLLAGFGIDFNSVLTP